MNLTLTFPPLYFLSISIKLGMELKKKKLFSLTFISHEASVLFITMSPTHTPTCLVNALVFFFAKVYKYYKEGVHSLLKWDYMSFQSHVMFFLWEIWWYILMVFGKKIWNWKTIMCNLNAYKRLVGVTLRSQFLIMTPIMCFKSELG